MLGGGSHRIFSYERSSITVHWFSVTSARVSIFIGASHLQNSRASIRITTKKVTSHHHITTSPHHHITTSPHHHVTSQGQKYKTAKRVIKFATKIQRKSHCTKHRRWDIIPNSISALIKNKTSSQFDSIHKCINPKTLNQPKIYKTPF
jgi:hypothetical protein